MDDVQLGDYLDCRKDVGNPSRSNDIMITFYSCYWSRYSRRLVLGAFKNLQAEDFLMIFNAVRAAYLVLTI